MTGDVNRRGRRGSQREETSSSASSAVPVRPFWDGGRTRAVVFLVALFCAGGCERAGSPAGQAGAPWFVEVTGEVGLDFVHDAGLTGNYFMPEVMGSGGALFDLDGDGRLDVYLIQNAGDGSAAKNRLYRQGGDGKFVDVSAGSGLDVAARGMGAAVADANNDGKPDLLLTELGRARLFLNRGGMKFADATREAGIDNPLWGCSAAWVDFDRDGWLDLAIANYVLFSATRPCTDQSGRRDYCGPMPFPGSVTKLYRNLGKGSGAGAGPNATDGARFEDVTIRSGLAHLTGPGLGVACADFDGDRWPDIFIANDAKANHLWMNQRDGTFKEEAVERGLAYNAMGQAQANMGIAIGDVDIDGLFDVYVTHLNIELHALWKQGPRGFFTDVTARAGLAGPEWPSTGFGTVFADFDRNGTLDIAQVNGSVRYTHGPSAPGESFWEVYRERNQVFSGDGKGRFADVSLANGALCGRRAIARGLAMGDVDGDGAIDLLVTETAGPARLLRNVAARVSAGGGHWLFVRAVDPAQGGRDAIGAEVAVDAGGRRRVGLVLPHQSYLVTMDPRVHFGLGSAQVFDSLRVVWPDGSEEAFAGGAADRVVLLEKGHGVEKGRGNGSAPRAKG